MTLPPSHNQSFVPEQDCQLCPRLAAHRQQIAQAYPNYFNAPVPAFGALDARLLIVGLAPGLHGANATGRPFTGDYAGDLLYKALLKYGFATGIYDRNPNDGLQLNDVRITNTVKCLPPENRPTGKEVTTCRRFLAREIAMMPNLWGLLTLGTVAHGSVIRAFGLKLRDHPFGHGRWTRCKWPDSQGTELTVVSSYHCSRYNTQTNRLSENMFMKIFQDIKEKI